MPRKLSFIIKIFNCLESKFNCILVNHLQRIKETADLFRLSFSLPQPNEEEVVVPPLADKGSVNTREDPSPTQTVEDVLVDLELKGDDMSAESPEASGEGKDEASNNMLVEEVIHDETKKKTRLNKASLKVRQRKMKMLNPQQ